MCTWSIDGFREQDVGVRIRTCPRMLMRYHGRGGVTFDEERGFELVAQGFVSIVVHMGGLTPTPEPHRKHLYIMGVCLP